MARDSAGVYTLPNTVNPVVSETPITTDWANTTLGDIETELTNSLDRAGRGAMTQPLQLPDGSAAAPALTFSADTNTGLYRVGADSLGISAGGTLRARVDTGQVLTIDGALATPALSFLNDTNIGLYRAGADDLRVGINSKDIAQFTTKLSASAATAATGGTRQDALSLTNGDLDFSAVTYPNSTTAMSNRLGPMHYPKAWTVVTITGAGTFTITQAVGCNVSAVARASASTFTITFGSAFSSTTYGISATCLSHTIGSGADVTLDPSGLSRATGSMTAGLSVNGTSVASLDGWGGGTVAILTILFWGQQ